jgi:hypothetical protein
MAIRLHSPLIAVVLGLSLAHAKPVAAADLGTAAQNFVNNDIEVDQFDSSGLLTDGFYLHISAGNIGARYFSAFDFAPSATTAAPEPATRSMMMIGFWRFRRDVVAQGGIAAPESLIPTREN